VVFSAFRGPEKLEQYSAAIIAKFIVAKDKSVNGTARGDERYECFST
jgi:hypothetical protein